MKGDYLEIPKMSLVSILRWLAVSYVVLGIGAVIVLSIISPGIAVPAIVSTGLKDIVFVAMLLYAVSFTRPMISDMKTRFGVSIHKMLRYTIIAILILGLLELIFNIVAAAVLGTALFIYSIFVGILITIVATIVFYCVYLLIKDKSPEPVDEEPRKPKAVNPPKKEDDWFDSLLHDVDKPTKH